MTCVCRGGEGLGEPGGRSKGRGRGRAEDRLVATERGLALGRVDRDQRQVDIVTFISGDRAIQLPAV